MKDERPSRTAEYTALLRALADIGMTSATGFSDPCAQKMLTPFFACLHGAARFVSTFGASGILRHQFAPVVDLLAMRTLAIDQILLAATSKNATAKIEQVVLLGAGLDCRAFRLPGMADITAFEVDHPASQRYKRSQTAGMAPLTRSLICVAVDFEKDSLDEKLLAAGFDPNRSSIWIWEGVVMYLSDAAMRSTLSSISRLSAKDSLLVTEYREPTVNTDFWQSYMDGLLRRCGEPQIGLRTEQTMSQELATAGFTVISDEGMSDWSRKFKGNAPSTFAIPARCVVGRADGNKQKKEPPE
jgi:methyltransferase (TIGR00027 family)